MTKDIDNMEIESFFYLQYRIRCRNVVALSS